MFYIKIKGLYFKVLCYFQGNKMEEYRNLQTSLEKKPAFAGFNMNKLSDCHHD